MAHRRLPITYPRGSPRVQIGQKRRKSWRTRQDSNLWPLPSEDTASHESDGKSVHLLKFRGALGSKLGRRDGRSDHITTTDQRRSAARLAAAR